MGTWALSVPVFRQWNEEPPLDLHTSAQFLMEFKKKKKRSNLDLLCGRLSSVGIEFVNSRISIVSKTAL